MTTPTRSRPAGADPRHKGEDMIKTWNQRCEEHPDHQTGMINNNMIRARMQEEIDDLRAALAQQTEFNFGEHDVLVPISPR